MSKKESLVSSQNETIKKPQKKKRNKFKKWVKRHKVLTIIISIILVIAIVLSGFVIAAKSKSDDASYSFIRTTTLAKGTLDDSISATGKVASVSTSSVSTTLNYTVKSVNVAVGDTVKKGDVIVALDTTELESQIEKENENLASSKEQAQASYDSASESYKSATSTLNTAKTSLNTAKTALNTAKVPYQNAKNAISSYQSAYDTALKNYNTAGAAYVSAQSAYNSAVSNYKKGSISASKLVSVAKAYMKAVQNYYGNCSVGEYDISDSSAVTSSNQNTQSTPQNSSQNAATNSTSSTSVTVSKSADSICSSVIKNISSLCNKTLSIPSGSNALYKLSQKAASLQNAKLNCNFASLESAYESAKSNYDTAKNEYDQANSSLSQAKNQLSQAKTELSKASTSDTLSNLQSELAQCNLTASQSGTVTALNATVGSSCKDSVATIVDTNNLKISITIAEADINNAKVGMSCYITSDATDGTLNGTLTQISPTSDESGTFAAEVTVTSKDSGLLIGMNASVEIIVSSAEDIFQVPIDAVGNDDTGDFVYRQTGGEGTDMTFEKVYVTKGQKNDYYIEVTGNDLKEGDVIRSSSDLSEGIESTSSSSDSSSSGFNLASLFGGGTNDRGAMKQNRSGASNMGGSSTNSSGGTPADMPSGGAPSMGG